MKQLTRVQHCGLDAGYEGPSYILVGHLHMNSMTRSTRIDLNKNWFSTHYNPCLRKLTCDYNIQFDNINLNVKSQSGLKNTRNMNIETLRLRYFGRDSSCDICNNNIVIETLNLQNSLENLMLNIDVTDAYDQNLNQWQNVIESIVKKKHFYKLKNVIILLGILKHKDIDWIFKMLKKNVGLLKYQFEQFIIGLHFNYTNHYVLEWNKAIDKRYLNKLKLLCIQNNDNQEIQDRMQNKYESLRKEWSS